MLAPVHPPAEAPPTTSPTGQIVLDVWRPILRIADLGPDTSVLKAGATSVELALAYCELEDRIGRPFPPVWMFEHPTPAALAARIDSTAAEGDERASDLQPSSPIHLHDSERSGSFLVPIRTSGANPPFFFTGLGAGLLTCGLAHRLGRNQPVYALLTYSVDERRMDHRAFVEIASRYVSDIKDVQPTGPYLLGGFCGQGPMVFEMAQQLVDAGDRVALVAIFDIQAPRRSSAPYRLREALYWTATKVRFHAAGFSRLEPRDRADYLRARMRNLWIRFSGTRPRARRRAGRSDSTVNAPALASRTSQRVLRYQLTMRYTPRKYPGRIALFVGEDARFSYDTSYGWRTLAEGVDVHEVPGIHTQMLTPPHDVSLANMLAGAIQNALTTPAASARTG